MKVILETLCGCSREWDARTDRHYPEPEVHIRIVEPMTIPRMENCKPTATVEMRERVFEFTHRQQNGMFVYRERWEKKAKS